MNLDTEDKKTYNPPKRTYSFNGEPKLKFKVGL